jgi:large subunit ribosomal protein L9
MADTTEIILIVDVYKLGRVGDVVKVKPGYARNYLIPQGKAYRATKANISAFEAHKVELIQKAADNKANAQALAQSLAGKVFNIIEQASDKGMLYGAVTAISAGKLLNDNGFAVAKDAVQIIKPLKSVGLHEVQVVLHPEVSCAISLNIAVSNEEAAKNLAAAEKEQQAA